MIDSRIALSAVLLATAVSACGRSTDSGVASVTLHVDNDSNSLTSRFEPKRDTIALDSGSASLNLVGLFGTTLSFTTVLVGNVTPPSVGGAKLQANAVFMNGTKAYVSYNMAGASGAGGLDVIDLAVPALPVIASNVTSPTSDFNSVTQSGSKVYITGGNPAAAKTAFLQTIPLTSNGLLTGTATVYTLPSFAGTDAAVSGNYVYATSGDQGGVTVFDKATMTQVAYTAVSDARAVKVAGDGTIRVLSGQPGRISSLSATGANLITTSLGGAATAQSKSTLEIDRNWTLASVGEAGFKVVCNATSATLSTTAPIAVSGVPSATTVTNAVTTANGLEFAGYGLLFAANGEAGLQAYATKDGAPSAGCTTPVLTLLGTLNLGTGVSVNGVYYQNGLLYVVTGSGGLKILTIDGI